MTGKELEISGETQKVFAYLLIAPSSGPYCNEQLKTSLDNLKDGFIYPHTFTATKVLQTF